MTKLSMSQVMSSYLISIALYTIQIRLFWHKSVYLTIQVQQVSTSFRVIGLPEQAPTVQDADASPHLRQWDHLWPIQLLQQLRNGQSKDYTKISSTQTSSTPVDCYTTCTSLSSQSNHQPKPLESPDHPIRCTTKPVSRCTPASSAFLYCQTTAGSQLQVFPDQFPFPTPSPGSAPLNSSPPLLPPTHRAIFAFSNNYP